MTVLKVSNYKEYQQVSLSRLQHFPKWEIIEFLIERAQVYVVIGLPQDVNVEDPYLDIMD